MSLALLVYVVNNLTYNGSFFYVLGTLLVLIYAVAYFVRIFCTGVRRKPVITVGSIYTLEHRCGIFDAGEQIRVLVKWGPLDECKVETLDGKKRDSGVRLSCLSKAVQSDTVDFVRFKEKKAWMYTGLLLLALHVLLPSKQTTMYMAGAYLVETVITSEKAQKLSDATYDAALIQVKKWSEESPELKDLIKPLMEKTNETN